MFVQVTVVRMPSTYALQTPPQKS